MFVFAVSVLLTGPATEICGLYLSGLVVKFSMLLRNVPGSVLANGHILFNSFFIHVTNYVISLYYSYKNSDHKLHKLNHINITVCSILITSRYFQNLFISFWDVCWWEWDIFKLDNLIVDPAISSKWIYLLQGYIEIHFIFYLSHLVIYLRFWLINPRLLCGKLHATWKYRNNNEQSIVPINDKIIYLINLNKMI